MNPKLFAILISIVIFLYVVELIRRQKMTFKYSMLWFGGCLFVLTLTFHDHLIDRLSHLAGFTLPSNFVFFLLLVFFIALSLSLTVYINEQNIRTETLAQSIAALQYEIQKLKKAAAQRREKD